MILETLLCTAAHLPLHVLPVLAGDPPDGDGQEATVQVLVTGRDGEVTRLVTGGDQCCDHECQAGSAKVLHVPSISIRTQEGAASSELHAHGAAGETHCEQEAACDTGTVQALVKAIGLDGTHSFQWSTEAPRSLELRELRGLLDGDGEHAGVVTRVLPLLEGKGLHVLGAHDCEAEEGEGSEHGIRDVLLHAIGEEGGALRLLPTLLHGDVDGYRVFKSKSKEKSKSACCDCECPHCGGGSDHGAEKGILQQLLKSRSGGAHAPHTLSIGGGEHGHGIKAILKSIPALEGLHGHLEHLDGIEGQLKGLNLGKLHEHLEGLNLGELHEHMKDGKTALRIECVVEGDGEPRIGGLIHLPDGAIHRFGDHGESSEGEGHGTFHIEGAPEGGHGVYRIEIPAGAIDFSIEDLELDGALSFDGVDLEEIEVEFDEAIHSLEAVDFTEGLPTEIEHAVPAGLDAQIERLERRLQEVRKALESLEKKLGSAGRVEFSHGGEEV